MFKVTWIYKSLFGFLWNAIFYFLLVKKNFKMIWNISDLSLRDWIWERITSKYILYSLLTLWLSYHFIFLGNKKSKGRKGRILRTIVQTMTRWNYLIAINTRREFNFQVPTRESLLRTSELLVNAKQGPKKGGRRKI